MRPAFDAMFTIAPPPSSRYGSVAAAHEERAGEVDADDALASPRRSPPRSARSRRCPRSSRAPAAGRGRRRPRRRADSTEAEVAHVDGVRPGRAAAARRSRRRSSRRPRRRGRATATVRPLAAEAARGGPAEAGARPVTIATRSVKRATSSAPPVRRRRSRRNLTAPSDSGTGSSVAAVATPHSSPTSCATRRAAHPEREAYVHGDKRVTYAWLDRAADGFAATLARPRRRSAATSSARHAAPSSIKFAACYLGALRVGAITSAINLRLGATEQASILERTEPAVTVRRRRRRRSPTAPTPGTVLAVADAARTRSPPSPPPTLPDVVADRPDVHRVDERHDRRARRARCTTTSAQAAISRNIGELTRARRPPARRAPVPARRLHDPRCGTSSPTARRSCSPGEPWSAAETLRLIRDEGITMATGVPTQWAARPRAPRPRDAPTSRSCGSRGIGAAAIPPELVRRMREVARLPGHHPLHEHRGRRHHEHARRRQPTR